MTTTKNDVFIFLLDWIDSWRGGNKYFLGKGEGRVKFLLVGGTPPITPVGKTLYIYIYIYYIYYLYIYIFIYYILFIYIYIYLYIYILYICIYINKRTLPTGFYIQWRKSMYITCMCQSGHPTSARFENFVCHRCICYIFSLVCSANNKFIYIYIYIYRYIYVQLV